jgi:hypothetical protein
MIELQKIIDITTNYCMLHGGELRSRQIRGLAEAITTSVNEELSLLDKRLKVIENKNEVRESIKNSNFIPKDIKNRLDSI